MKTATQARKLGKEPGNKSNEKLEGYQEIESLKELAGLLKSETDRWSRQVILAEAAQKLGELERRLKVKAS